MIARMNLEPSPTRQDESRSYQKPAIRPEMTVRQVAADYPPCREIFVAYGEPTDRPGKFGHFQPLTHFARCRDICLDKLLEQLSQAANVPIDRSSGAAERIHRSFIVAALAITLSLGAAWGAWLLWRIGTHQDFDAVAAAHIVAHGEAQLWGFIGFFIVGISLRTVLLDAVRSRSGQYVCIGLFAFALISLAGGFAWSIVPRQLSALGLASGVALLVVSLLFWGVQIWTLWPKRRLTWARAVMLSGWWLTIWAAATCFLRWQAGSAGPGTFSTTARLLLIELAVFGFAMNSIYGFGQLLLPGFLRTGRTRGWAIEAAFWLHNLGVAFIVMSSTDFASKVPAVAGISSIAAGAIFFAIGQHVFIGKPRTSHRPEQGHRLLDLYIPLAFFWLILSMLLLVAGHCYELVSQVTPPHAFTGAVRHALTVGFMTTLILGVGQRFLPVLEHTILRRQGFVAPILILIAAGNLLRVTFELATMWVAGAYFWMPISAVLEWTALLLFAISVCSLMWHTDSLFKSGHVTNTSSLAVLLAEHPWLENHLIERGSSYLARARTVPRELTIGTFAHSEGEPADALVDDLNRLLLDTNRGLRPPHSNQIS